MTTKHDPTRQQTRVQRAEASMRVRWRKAKARCVAYVENLPRREVTTNATYRFDVDATMLERTIADLQTLMLDEMGSYWLYDEYVSQAYASGTGMAITTLSAQTPAYVATIDSVLSAPAYQARVGLLRSRIFEQMVGFSDGYGQQLGDLLGRAVLDGLNPLDVAKTITERFDIDLYRAERIARTEITTAARRGRLDEGDAAAEATGMRVMYMHVSAFAPTSRQSHMARHGNLVTGSDAREWWSKDANSINCFLPNTKVSGRFVAGSKAQYRGLVVKIMTASGRNLTVTPNHPILTNTGLVGAAKLNKGDYAVAYIAQVENSIGVSALNDKQVDARIDEVFATLVEIGHSFTTGVSAVNFHGDGANMNEDIHIVNMEGVLNIGLDATGGQLLDNLALKHADSGLSKPKRPIYLNVNAIGGAAPRISRGLRDAVFLFRRHFSVRNSNCIGVVALPKSMFVKISSYCYSGKTNIVTNVKNGLARLVPCVKFGSSVDIPKKDAPVGAQAPLLNMVNNGILVNTKASRKLAVADASFVELDEIVDISFLEYDGHVYDLQEESGLMIADGLVTSNCLCSIIEVFVDSNGDPLAPGLLKRAQQIKAKYDKN